jgi:pimeloyl-ACP methyl ester carboxylesterase
MHVKKIWVVGHSWGASLALHFAAHYSERVKNGGYINEKMENSIVNY